MKDVLTAALEGPGPAKKAPLPERFKHGTEAAQAKVSAPGKTAPRRKGATGVRPGTKSAKILALLARPRGASLKEITKAIGWQPHSVRGFLSGVVTKQMGIKIRSTKDESGLLRYSTKS